VSINVAVLTVSDRSYTGEREDLSGPALCHAVQKLGWKVIANEIVPDEINQITQFLNQRANDSKINLILTTGGTGFSPRDVTPEATLSVIQKRAPGLSEKIRLDSSLKNAHSFLSRGEAGILNNCLIINLPGSPSGAVESFETISPLLPHAISILSQSSNPEATHQFSSHSSDH